MSPTTQVALITGAGSGIGKGAALQLASDGIRIACLGRTVSQLDEVVAEIESSGGEAMAVRADVSHPDQIQAAVKQVTNAWGRIDIVVANAGINGVWAPVDEITPDEWDQTLDINLRGTFLTVKYALPWLKKDGGSIVVVSSVNGTRMFSNSGASAYASSKAAQVAFTKMTALELAPHKVRINCICPGGITTEISDNTYKRNMDDIGYPVEYPAGKIPLTHGKPGTIEQVGKLIAFLASPAADHITGTEMWIDGAQSLLQG
jgi:NAD(P)-dependent dehydrogenase (short-subunit alcohol dehydrogenase family)